MPFAGPLLAFFRVKLRARLIADAGGHEKFRTSGNEDDDLATGECCALGVAQQFGLRLGADLVGKAVLCPGGGHIQSGLFTKPQLEDTSPREPLNNSSNMAH